MVSVYTFVADVIAPGYITSQEEFRDAIEPHLLYLRSFPVAYGKSECTEAYYSPSVGSGKLDDEFWAFRLVLSLSVGKNKIEPISKMYEALLTLLSYELPEFRITAESSCWDFSS
jgi:hypothetical protein